VLICDTPKCGTETHLRCAGLDAVPEGDWFCDACSAKNWKRKASGAPAKPKRPRRETAAAAPKHASPVVLSPAVVSAEVDAAFADDETLRCLVRQRRVTSKAVRARVAVQLGVDEVLLKAKALKAALRDASARAETATRAELQAQPRKRRKREVAAAAAAPAPPAPVASVEPSSDEDELVSPMHSRSTVGRGAIRCHEELPVPVTPDARPPALIDLTERDADPRDADPAEAAEPAEAEAEAAEPAGAAEPAAEPETRDPAAAVAALEASLLRALPERRAVSFGCATVRSGGVVSEPTERHEPLVRELTAFYRRFRPRGPGSRPGTGTITSIWVNRTDDPLGLHRDASNSGLSSIMAFGDFASGGELEIDDVGAVDIRPFRRDASDPLYDFDAVTRAHRPMPWDGGSRWTVTFYCVRSPRLDAEDRAYLASLGFPLPRAEDEIRARAADIEARHTRESDRKLQEAAALRARVAALEREAAALRAS